MNKDALSRLIRKCMAGTNTSAERQQLDSWWNEALHDDCYRNEISQRELEILKQSTFENLQSIINKEIQKESTGRIRTMYYPLRAIAACLVICVIAFVALIYWSNTDEISVRTSYGERITVTLPDGSLAILNGNSSLLYKRWRDNEDRNVWLNGEAYFEVKHTKKHNRFIVHNTDSLRVEVLGTQFTVNNRTGETNVVLQEGKVRLQKESKTLTMEPNEMVSFSREKNNFVKQNVNASQRVSWKDNVLIFQDESLEEIASHLKASHGIIIVFVNDAYSNEIFNGSIPGDSVELLFEKIEKLYGAEVTRDQDGNYIIK